MRRGARLVVAASAMLAGCWSSSQSTPAAPSGPIAIKVAPAANRYAAALADPLGFLPGDAMLAIDVDVAHLRDSSLFQHYASQLKQLGHMDSLIPATCFELYDTLDGFTLGVSFTPATPDDARGVAVVRGVELAQMRDCLKATPSTDVKQLSATRLQSTSAKSIGYLEWIEPRTVVMFYGAGATPADLDRALAGAVAHPHPAGPLAEAYANVPGVHTGWLVMLPSSVPQLQQGLAGLGVSADVGWLTFDLDAALAVVVHLRVDTPASASALEQKLTGQLGMLKGWFDRLDISAADRDLVIDLRASQANIDGLGGMFGGLFGSGTTPPPPAPPTPPTP